MQKKQNKINFHLDNTIVYEYLQYFELENSTILSKKII